MLDGIIGRIKNMSMVAKIVIGVISIGSLLIIVAAIVVANQVKMKDVPLTEIANIDDVSESMPFGYKNVVKRMLSEIINDNTATAGLVFSEAEIREGTYEEIIGDSSVDAKFIVDVPELRYSFQVEVIWPAKVGKNEEKIEDPNVTIKCPHYLDVIYADTKCIAQTPEQQLERYLPYYEDLDSGQRFGVSMKKFGGEPYVAVEVKSCGDSSVAEKAVNATKKWMKSIYLDPNDYTIKSMDICKR